MNNFRRRLVSAKPKTIMVDGYEAVDLGLPSGVLWATGDLKKSGNVYILADPYTEDATTWFSYGNTTGYNRYYDNDGNQVFSENYYNITKGGKLTAPFTSGDLEYDAARKNMGGGWRIPTTDEIQELISNCSWSVDTNNNIRILIGTNAGNEIFMRPIGYRLMDTVQTSGHCIMQTGYIYAQFDNTSRIYGASSQFEVSYRGGTYYPNIKCNIGSNPSTGSGTNKSPYIYNGIYVRAVHDAI